MFEVIVSAYRDGKYSKYKSNVYDVICDGRPFGYNSPTAFLVYNGNEFEYVYSRECKPVIESESIEVFNGTN